MAYNQSLYNQHGPSNPSHGNSLYQQSYGAYGAQYANSQPQIHAASPAHSAHQVSYPQSQGGHPMNPSHQQGYPQHTQYGHHTHHTHNAQAPVQSYAQYGQQYASAGYASQSQSHPTPQQQQQQQQYPQQHPQQIQQYSQNYPQQSPQPHSYPQQPTQQHSHAAYSSMPPQAYGQSHTPSHGFGLSSGTSTPAPRVSHHSHVRTGSVQAASSQPETCYNCGLPGHFAQNCPEPRREVPAGQLKRRQQSSFQRPHPTPAQWTGQPMAAQPSYPPANTKPGASFIGSSSSASSSHPLIPSNTPLSSYPLAQNLQSTPSAYMQPPVPPQFNTVPEPLRPSSNPQVPVQPPQPAHRQTSWDSTSMPAPPRPLSVVSNHASTPVPTLPPNTNGLEALISPQKRFMVPPAALLPNTDAQQDSQQRRPSPSPSTDLPPNKMMRMLRPESAQSNRSDGPVPQPSLPGEAPDDFDELKGLDLPDLPRSTEQWGEAVMSKMGRPLPSNFVTADALWPMAAPEADANGTCRSRYFDGGFEKALLDIRESAYWAEHEHDPIFQSIVVGDEVQDLNECRQRIRERRRPVLPSASPSEQSRARSTKARSSEAAEMAESLDALERALSEAKAKQAEMIRKKRNSKLQSTEVASHSPRANGDLVKIKEEDVPERALSESRSSRSSSIVPEHELKQELRALINQRDRSLSNASNSKRHSVASSNSPQRRRERKRPRPISNNSHKREIQKTGRPAGHALAPPPPPPPPPPRETETTSPHGQAHREIIGDGHEPSPRLNRKRSHGRSEETSSSDASDSSQRQGTDTSPQQKRRSSKSVSIYNRRW